jgi:hypothetical protein
MADIVFNIAKGRVNSYAALAGTGNAALILVPIETTGIESDATLQDYDTLSALLAAANNEQTAMGRKTITSATVTPDDTNNRNDADFADQTYTAATGNPISAFLVCYDPDTTSGDDTTVVPLTKHDFVATPDGNNILVGVSTFFRAS